MTRTPYAVRNEQGRLKRTIEWYRDGLRRCSHCEEYLDPALFQRHASSHVGDGLQTFCKVCSPAIRRKSYLRHRKRETEYALAWQKAHPEQALAARRRARRVYTRLHKRTRPAPGVPSPKELRRATHLARERAENIEQARAAALALRQAGEPVTGAAVARRLGWGEWKGRQMLRRAGFLSDAATAPRGAANQRATTGAA